MRNVVILRSSFAALAAMAQFSMGPSPEKTTGGPPDLTTKVRNASILFQNSFAATVVVAQQEDDSDSDGSGGGFEHEKYKRGAGRNPTRHPLVSSHSTPAITKIKGSRDRHYRQKGSGGALSPDDTGYGRGGSTSSGRSDSYGRGGY
ncbi:hypothetical protein INS49_003001 [Diaporthe citri]|uniref:uncharacterized protein n=1 Tax=Diaporthe citri TaxID=83186 RepID=UPI001C8131AC|nr:uncharacterized protein INS49_003001 [Diaporthe citri]KAG6368787.1 hypothetical protein INS49_003001 [Diaporthe citri]